MKVAIAHDYLNQYGGAERVLEAFLKIFPDAHLYTLLSDRDTVRARFASALKATSFLDMPFVARHHHPFIPLMPLAAQSLRLKDRYDLLISATAGYAKGIRVPAGTYHLSYCYTPLRYAWEPEYIPHAFNPQRTLSGRLSNWLVAPTANYLKRWDRAMADRPHSMLAISRFIQEKIRTYYGREADVVYPPVDADLFYFDARKKAVEPKEPYYLAAGRLLHYKKFDLVSQAFRNLELPLKIVGAGKEAAKLRRMSADKSNIQFLDFVPNDELRGLYAGARALIFPQVEDFGLVAAEAQSCGTPVVAFRKGGALEIVEDGKTGVFFNEQNVGSLIKAIQTARTIRFNKAYIARRAKAFSFGAFKKGILSHIPKEIRQRSKATFI
jgi:glycosyltransferase involved in cell wall biosynthesis